MLCRNVTRARAVGYLHSVVRIGGAVGVLPAVRVVAAYLCRRLPAPVRQLPAPTCVCDCDV